MFLQLRSSRVFILLDDGVGGSFRIRSGEGFSTGLVDVLMHTLKQPDAADDRGMGDLQEDNAGTSQMGSWKTEAEWADQDQRDEVQRWVEVSEAVASRCLEHVN